MNKSFTTLFTIAVGALVGCSSHSDEAKGTVQLMNDFNNTEMAYQPPWTICESSYLGVDFGKISLGDTSDAKQVSPGLDYVLMVAAWNDTSCSPENALPLASKSEEEVVDGQTRTIALNMTNHQGPCPPEGTEPIPEEQYNRILTLWPEYDFASYDERTSNTQCTSDSSSGGEGGSSGEGGATSTSGGTTSGGTAGSSSS